MKKPKGLGGIGGPQINEYGMYQHGIFCSGSDRHPRTPGNTCSCHSCDLWYNRLSIERHGASGGLFLPASSATNTDAKRTLWVAACPGCHKRTEFPFISESIPKEVFCQDCSLWIKVEELSWDGLDFAKLLPIKERK